jgi:1,4-alpha-glucan branching enzyme
MAALAIVLHAHLPWVREPNPWSWTERWFHEALWECHLPLVGLLDRLANDGVRAPFTLSVSPPLLCMLRDPLLGDRFEAHLATIEALNERHGGRHPTTIYRERIAAARATWQGRGRNLVAALAEHASAGHIELVTTSASHAFLPALAPVDGAQAQLDIGAASFARHTGLREPTGRWLPECAIDESVRVAMAAARVGHTVVESYALEAARPRASARRPIVTPEGVALFARDRKKCDRVWSRHAGYPGNPAYREFHRDLGFELAGDEAAPFGAGTMTGLKYHAIDGTPYDPRRARAQCIRDATDFVGRARGEGAPEDIVVAAYDAELFGHWWFEGPTFLEHVLRLAAAAADVELITLAEHRARYPRLMVAEPSPSSWGASGSFRSWVGPRTARIWPLVHAMHRDVVDAARAGHPRTGDAIRELMLLEASDWPFMITMRDTADYGERRIADHSQRIRACLAGEPVEPSGFASELTDAELIERIRPNAWTTARSQPAP